MNELDRIVIDKVLSNEMTCRMMLTEMMRRGLKINIDPDSLSQEECIMIIRKVMDELQRREAH